MIVADRVEVSVTSVSGENELKAQFTTRSGFFRGCTLRQRRCAPTSVTCWDGAQSVNVLSVAHSISATGALVNQPGLSTLRRWPRYRLDLPVRVIAEKPGKTVIGQGRGTELNEGGLALFVGLELAIGEPVAVEFTATYSGQPMRARAVVRNRSAYTYGVEFLMDTNDDIGNASQIRSVLRAMAEAIK
jgi:PilZ domain